MHTKIHQLPEEIILKIITDCVKVSDDRSFWNGYLEREWVGFRRVWVVHPVRSSGTPLIPFYFTSSRSWSTTLDNSPSLWSFISLDWHPQTTNLHCRLSRDAPLHVWWPLYTPNTSKPSARYGSMISLINRVKSLRLVYSSIPCSDVDDPMLALEFLSHCVSKVPECCLKTLKIRHVLDGADASQALLPALHPLELVDLDLHDCWSPERLPSTLRTINITTSEVTITVHDIYRVLLECPLLETCILEMRPDTNISRQNPDTLPDNSLLELPCLRTLRIGVLPLSHVDWLYKRFLAKYLTSNTISIYPLSDPATPFFLPEGLQGYASRATSLDIRQGELIYCLEDQFRHSIIVGTATWASLEQYTSSTFQKIAYNFGSLRQLHIECDRFISKECAHWVQGLADLNRLRQLHICGHDIATLLVAFCQADCLLCPELNTLSLDVLKDLPSRSWIEELKLLFRRGAHDSSEGDSSEVVSPASAISTEEGLESFLNFRKARGFPIQHLILRGDCEPGLKEKWRSHMTVVDRERDIRMNTSIYLPHLSIHS
ncbi:hypothetical protein SISSUDRAFT_1068067 [Sistotremastrum suecicum HHB10207 ss-3]|uniref:F-box domain-containing protein n=1 Tax=Sistotremastrum suecicum HHB10207 ss-3 TaxID=1314776 RepID=A0A165WGH6_9AGAM|nr:hypothetical protein SISSUDRAFT_1068067 [Sistotremastrum suecicum HHB10207 ss-3]